MPRPASPRGWTATSTLVVGRSASRPSGRSSPIRPSAGDPWFSRPPRPGEGTGGTWRRSGGSGHLDGAAELLHPGVFAWREALGGRSDELLEGRIARGEEGG